MDLDALAGIVGYKHTGDSVTTVTAAVDRITIKRPLTEICDLELSGRVTYATGRSSMEVSLQVARAPVPGKTVSEEDIMMTCQFTMVSLDPVTRKPTQLPAIQPETDEEKQLFAAGEKNSQHRKGETQGVLAEASAQSRRGRIDTQHMAATGQMARSKRSRQTTGQRSAYGSDEDADHSCDAAAVPQPASLHDLWRVR